MAAEWYPLISGHGAVRVVAVSIFILGLVLVLVAIRHFSIQYPVEIPRVREPGRTRFSLRTRLAYYTDCAGLFRDAYEQVCIGTPLWSIPIDRSSSTPSMARPV